MKDEFEGVIRSMFEVRETVDDKGRLGQTVGYFFNENDAHDAAVGQGWYGSDGVVTPRFSLRVNGSDYLLASKTPIEFGSYRNLLRQRALAKLTVEEREVLGL